VSPGRPLALARLVALAGLVASVPGTASALSGPGSAPRAEATVNSIGMRLVRIPAGEFEMGSPSNEPGHAANEGPVRHVRITRPFEIGAHEVTNAQFRAFAEVTAYETEAQLDVEGGLGLGLGIDFERAVVVRHVHADWRNPGFPGFLPGPDHPVLLVSWQDAEAFCRWLSTKEGRTYRLPTEAEWEYAARAGTNTPWWTGGDPAALATGGNTADVALRTKVPRAKWSAGWTDGHAFLAPVGSFEPNAFGLHDVHGNVWEWCLDWYGSDARATSPVDDPQGPATGSFRAARGGSWWNDATLNRSAQRLPGKPMFRFSLLTGFRVVREFP
jgi:sulfatase modifying factor 1